MTNPRLPWERNPTGGFIAWPEGREQNRRHAAIYFRESGYAGGWGWGVQYDDASSYGIADDKQAAADAATKAWPEIKKAAAELVAKAEREAQMDTRIERFANGEETDGSVFANAAANYENMMWVMERIKRRSEPGVLKLAAALSAEFFRRRS